jgi:hypothetical protein
MGNITPLRSLNRTADRRLQGPRFYCGKCKKNFKAFQIGEVGLLLRQTKLLFMLYLKLQPLTQCII